MGKNYFTRLQVARCFPLTSLQVRRMFECRAFPKEIVRIHGRDTECIEGTKLICFLNFIL